MQIDVQALGFKLTPPMCKHTERRLQFALDRTGAHVVRIWVRLSDLSGPRGGEDKRCHLCIALTGAPQVLIEDTEADLYVAIVRAADRVGRTVARRIERQCDQGHGPHAPIAVADMHGQPNALTAASERRVEVPARLNPA